MADDVVALMDVLKIPKADVVGWSDGGILGIDLARLMQLFDEFAHGWAGFG
jgi:pimeloyl-ACP methyl ester carboxylesterase